MKKVHRFNYSTGRRFSSPFNTQTQKFTSIVVGNICLNLHNYNLQITTVKIVMIEHQVSRYFKIL